MLLSVVHRMYAYHIMPLVLTVTAKAVESGFQTTVTFLPTSLMASYERRYEMTNTLG